MLRLRIRFMLTFFAGVVVAAAVSGLAASVVNSAQTRYDDLSLFTNVLTLVRSHYVEPIEDGVLIRGAVTGLLSELDPHSSFLDVEQYHEMQVDTRGEFHGLGIEITKHADGYIEVIAPIEGTPADRAGIESRDQIVKICPTVVPENWDEKCRSTKNMTLIEAVSLMRGKRGTEITIEIFREGFSEPRPFTVVRDVVQVVSVSGRMLEPGYAYVRIRSFAERTDDELHEVLARLRDESHEPFRGLVIDLRDNPGGLLDQAVKIADTWLDDGLVVYTEGRNASQRHEYKARPTGTEPNYPITVLVNPGSASASEIVAGALQDQRRALIIGQQTFGKGSVQTVYPLEDNHGLRLTTALYYTPAGRSIQEVGIAPDIVVDPAVVASIGKARRRIREADLEGHFTQGEASPDAATEAGEASEQSDSPSTDSDADGNSDRDDVQLTRALEVLKSWNYFEHLRDAESTPSLQANARGKQP